MIFFFFRCAWKVMSKFYTFCSVQILDPAIVFFSDSAIPHLLFFRISQLTHPVSKQNPYHEYNSSQKQFFFSYNVAQNLVLININFDYLSTYQQCTAYKKQMLLHIKHYFRCRKNCCLKILSLKCFELVDFIVNMWVIHKIRAEKKLREKKHIDMHYEKSIL